MSRKSILPLLAIMSTSMVGMMPERTEVENERLYGRKRHTSGGNTFVDQSNATGKKKKYPRSTKLTKRKRKALLQNKEVK